MKLINILVTGGAGYIGSKLVTKLIEKNYNVTVIDNMMFDKSSLDHLYIKKNFKFINNDISNKHFLKKILYKYDIVIPLAGYVGAPLCERNKKQAKLINFEMINYIVKNLKKKQKIIYLNSNSGYGIGKKNKFCDENSPLNPISLYGRTKVNAEKVVSNFQNSICLRLATVFGFSFRMRTDLLVNNFTYQLVKNKKILIYEPHFRRNFIHIDDVVDAIIFSIKNFKKMKSQIYNLGLSSANLTKSELATKIKKQINQKISIKYVTNIKDPDQRDYFVSNKKIEKTGFKCSVSLDQGIKELIQIFSKSKKNYINNY